MDVWIIRDGEKTGPIHDFEIRRKIETGELPATTPAWHEGLDAWKPLIEIELFTREFELAAIPRPAESPPGQILPPPLPQKTAYGRRFWARWFDLYLYSGFWWIAMWAVGQDIEAALLNPWVMFFQCVPWFALEALLIHKFATTPGKWLLGLQVANNDGSRLDLAAAIRRSLRVMFSGVGFGWGLARGLLPSPQPVHRQTPRRSALGSHRRPSSHRQPAEPLPPGRARRPVRRRAPVADDRHFTLPVRNGREIVPLPQGAIRKESSLASA